MNDTLRINFLIEKGILSIDRSLFGKRGKVLIGGAAISVPEDVEDVREGIDVAIEAEKAR